MTDHDDPFVTKGPKPLLLLPIDSFDGLLDGWDGDIICLEPWTQLPVRILEDFRPTKLVGNSDAKAEVRNHRLAFDIHDDDAFLHICGVLEACDPELRQPEEQMKWDLIRSDDKRHRFGDEMRARGLRIDFDVSAKGPVYEKAPEKLPSDTPVSMWMVMDPTKECRWVVLAKSSETAISTVGIHGHPMGCMPDRPLSAIRVGVVTTGPETIIEAGGKIPGDRDRFYSFLCRDRDDLGVVLSSSYPRRG